MPNKHEPLLLIELKPSKRLKRFLVFVYLLGLGASIANSLPIAVKLAFLIGICLHFWLILKYWGNQQCTIKHTEAVGWEVSEGNNFEPIEILESTVITIFAIFLHFKKDVRRKSLLIVNDALTEDDYRRLIVRLKTAGKK